MTSFIQWPMEHLTRQSGDGRSLIVHPDKAVGREYIKPLKDNGFAITDSKKIKIPNGLYWCEVKEQGHFHVYARNVSGEYSMYGRRLGVSGMYNDVYPKLAGAGILPELPSNTAIAVELIWPGNPDSAVPTAIKESPEELKVKAFGLAIHAGDCLVGKKISYMIARKRLISIFGRENCVSSYLVEISDKKDIELAALLARAKYDGIEGWVLKKYAYYDWWKLKGIREADVYITGFKISTSDTYFGQVTGVSIAVNADGGKLQFKHDMGKVSGFDDFEKHELTNAYKTYGETDENPYMGRCLRVTYQERAAKGKLKHAFFDGWRDDKSPEDCKLNQFE